MNMTPSQFSTITVQETETHLLFLVFLLVFVLLFVFCIDKCWGELIKQANNYSTKQTLSTQNKSTSRIYFQYIKMKLKYVITSVLLVAVYGKFLSVLSKWKHANVLTQWCFALLWFCKNAYYRRQLTRTTFRSRPTRITVEEECRPEAPGSAR